MIRRARPLRPALQRRPLLERRIWFLQSTKQSSGQRSSWRRRSAGPTAAEQQRQPRILRVTQTKLTRLHPPTLAQRVTCGLSVALCTRCSLARRRSRTKIHMRSSSRWHPMKRARWRRECLPRGQRHTAPMPSILSRGAVSAVPSSDPRRRNCSLIPGLRLPRHALRRPHRQRSTESTTM